MKCPCFHAFTLLSGILGKFLRIFTALQCTIVEHCHDSQSGKVFDFSLMGHNFESSLSQFNL